MTPEEWTAVRLSLLVATTATLASLPFGIAIAWLLARGQFWGKSLLDTLVHLPLIMPPVVTVYLLLISFGKRGPIGAFLDQAFGIVFSFRWTGAALACAVMGFPLLVRAIRLSIEAVDVRLESAAGTLGANPFWVFEHIHSITRQPLILLDLPPILSTDDTLVVAPKIDACLLVLSEGGSRRDGAARALDLLAEFKLAGIVLNRSHDVTKDYYSKY
jgi:ABC-type proline/glycine betaine transport system permease subunit